MKKKFTIIGMMSGTSLDGVDVALIQSDGIEYLNCGETDNFQYDREFAKRGLQISAELSNSNSHRSAKEIRTQYHDFSHCLTLLHVQAVEGFLCKHDLLPQQIDYIAFHGQTVLHRPQNALTIQLGKPELLAEKTSIGVIHSFRENDMKKGGQGAPLVPLFHHLLAKKYLKKYNNGAIVNIGGVANITFLYNIKADIADQIAACDCGPGNAMIDDMMRLYFKKPYDLYGKIACSAKVNENIVEKSLKNPFFAKIGAKSLDRNYFSLKDFAQLPKQECIASLTAFTADAITSCIRQRQKNAQFIAISGGGRHNQFILQRIKKYMPDKHVFNIDDFGINGDNLEAQALAYLGVRVLRKLPLTIPETTGVRQATTGGRIIHKSQKPIKSRN